MRYKHIAVSLERLIEITTDSGIQVGQDVVDHFLNVNNKGRRLIGFSATVAPDKGRVMPHFHFVFEEGVVVQ